MTINIRIRKSDARNDSVFRCNIVARLSKSNDKSGFPVTHVLGLAKKLLKRSIINKLSKRVL